MRIRLLVLLAALLSSTGCAGSGYEVRILDGDEQLGMALVEVEPLDGRSTRVYIGPSCVVDVRQETVETCIIPSLYGCAVDGERTASVEELVGDCRIPLSNPVGTFVARDVDVTFFEDSVYISAEGAIDGSFSRVTLTDR